MNNSQDQKIAPLINQPSAEEAEEKWRLLIQYLKSSGGHEEGRKLEEEGWRAIKVLKWVGIKLEDEAIRILGQTYCPQLSEIDMNKNKLANLDNLHTGNWPQLKQLWIRNNELTNINNLHKANWPQLQDLSIINNQLVNVDNLHKGNWPQLKLLWIRNNQLTSIDSLHQVNWPQLQTLSINNNQLVNVDNLHKGNWPKIQELRVGNNNIINKISVNSKLKQHFPKSIITT